MCYDTHRDPRVSRINSPLPTSCLWAVHTSDLRSIAKGSARALRGVYEVSVMSLLLDVYFNSPIAAWPCGEPVAIRTVVQPPLGHATPQTNRTWLVWRLVIFFCTSRACACHMSRVCLCMSGLGFRVVLTMLTVAAIFSFFGLRVRRKLKYVLAHRLLPKRDPLGLSKKVKAPFPTYLKIESTPRPFYYSYLLGHSALEHGEISSFCIFSVAFIKSSRRCTIF